ncbi:hypothetical protein BGZ76_003852 [Entomortierella beljakovae]|nr:hypothetical protein BGZ76_003852 [Entomortierella beljakovae]
MDLLLGNHLQESARRAAGSFLSPLTNAIGEQRRLVESLAVVSKVRVEECKHMMLWSKSQTDDLGDVLLKLNLLIRKISDYEIRFGTQYESFREKIKYLRTKDDSLCEMGRRQADLQNKILDASKSKLRSAKALLYQKELDDIQKDSPKEAKLKKLKREVIKGAYTEQLNAIIELGKKMQIIGEHGKQLLEHIDLPASISDGRQTEDILQAARISLENWDTYAVTISESVVVHPPPTPPRRPSAHSNYSTDSVQSLAVSEPNLDSESSDSDVEFVVAPASPLKAKPSVATTTSTLSNSSKKEQVAAAAVTKEKKPELVPAPAVETQEEEEEEEDEDDDDTPAKTPKQETLSPFGSTLVPKLTLNPTKPTTDSPNVPPRTSDWASEAAAAIASVTPKKDEASTKGQDTSASDAEKIRRQEELEMKKALELSLAEAKNAKDATPSGDLQLTAEELRFVMGDVAPKRSTKIVKRQARAPEATDDSTASTITRPAGSRRSRRVGVKVDTEVSHTDTESEKDLETPKASKPHRVVRGPQGAGVESNPISQQGPRPWVAEGESGDDDDTTSESSTVDLHGPEELANASEIGETMGESHDAPASVPKKVTASKTNQQTKVIYESMGSEPERPLESMGSEPERPLESMGDDGPDDSHFSNNNNSSQSLNNNNSNSSAPEVPFVPMPQMPSLDEIRQQKVMLKQQQQQHQQQQMEALGVSPELQYLQLQGSPQSINQQISGQNQGQSQGHPSPQTPHGSVHSSSPSPAHSQVGTYQTSGGYRPSTSYVPSPSKQKNRLSGSHSPSPGSSPAAQYQQQQQQQHSQTHNSGTYSAQYMQQQQQYAYQQQQQLQDFYYSPSEQEYQQQQYQLYQQQLREYQRQSSVSSVGSMNSNIGIAPLGWNLPGMAPPQVTEDDARHYNERYNQNQQYQQSHHRSDSGAGSIYSEGNNSSNAPSPSPSHISLISDHSTSPVIGSTGTPIKTSEAPLRTSSNQSKGTNPDDYKVEVK